MNLDYTNDKQRRKGVLVDFYYPIDPTIRPFCSPTLSS